MIRSFKCAYTEALSKGDRVKQFVNIAKVARRKLRQLEIAPVNTAFVSTNNGVSAFVGRMGAQKMWKSLITTKESLL